MKNPSHSNGSAIGLRGRYSPGLPNNAESKGRANRPGEPLDRNDGSAGGVALPNNAEPEGRANRPGEPLPQRKKLPHEIPSWVQQGERHFITINCKTKNTNQLLQNGIAEKLLANAEFYEQIGKWHIWLMLVMPDHIHFIATFYLSDGLKKTVSAWKSYLTKTLQIDWQSDFFEHRLRNQSEFEEKVHYIRMNPVRKGFVSSPEEWPHFIDRRTIEDGSAGGVALPDNPKCIGGANRPGEPLDRNDGSAGGVALPKGAESKGRANRPGEPDNQEN